MEIIESERLWLKPFTLHDCNFILELLNTEGWIKYIGDRNVRTIEQAANYLKNGPFKSYEMNGFGLSLVQLKTDNLAIGMCGLIRRDYLDYPDIGFAFLPNYSGHGYAFEIAGKVIEYGLNKIRLNRIFAITLPENYPSIALIKKLGLLYERNLITPDTNEELQLYSIKREDHGPEYIV